METQSAMMIPLVIYNQMRLRPCGSLLDYPSWEDCQVLTPPRFHPPTHCGLFPLLHHRHHHHHHHHHHTCLTQILVKCYFTTYSLVSIWPLRFILYISLYCCIVFGRCTAEAIRWLSDYLMIWWLILYLCKLRISLGFVISAGWNKHFNDITGKFENR